MATLRGKKTTAGKAMTGFRVCKSFVTFIKVIGILVCVVTFSFWTNQAIIKLMSMPISSSVTFKNGDDDQGNIKFPAVTICLTSFSMLANSYKQASDLMKHCATNEIASYIDIGRQCSPKDPPATSETTTTEGAFGGIFDDSDYYDTKEDMYTNITLMMQDSHLSVHDVVKESIFGNYLGVRKSYPKDLQFELRAEYWKETIDYRKGTCFTFDPALLGKEQVKMMVTNPGDGSSEELMFMTIEVNFMKLLNTSDNPYYSVYLHNSIYDRANMHLRQPDVYLGDGDKKLLLISKTNIVSLKKNEASCSDDPNYGTTKCLLHEANALFLQELECRMPWMNAIEFGNETDFCPIFGHPNGTYYMLTEKWTRYSTMKEVRQMCRFQPPCIRSLYTKSLEDWVSGENPSAFSARLQIQLSSQDVQVIEDHISYDAQSFVGEVGGTLGLLLGLSFISVFDLLDWFFASLETR